jgi:branched-chain amino acid transport system substrate-binding protein
VIYEDGRCTGKDATDAIQKLISVDKVKIVLGGTCSAETLAAGPIAMANHVILFSAFSSNPAISKVGEYMFRNSPSDSDVGALDANAMAVKFKKVAILSEDTDYSQGVRAVMKGVLQEKNISVAADETYIGNTTDFRTVLAKIKQANPEALYVNPGTSTKAGGIMVKQARQIGITVPIYGNFSLGTPDSLSTGGSYMNGVVISDTSPLSGRGDELLGKYKQKFGADPANKYLMGAAYDRVYIIKNALVAVGENPDKIKDFLHQMPNFSGAVGTYHFNPNGDVVGVGFINYTLENGKEIPLTP